MYTYKGRGSHRAAMPVVSPLEYLYISDPDETLWVAEIGHFDSVPPMIMTNNPPIGKKSNF